ncbi:MAG: glutamate--cysteine ligase [Rubrivivax sp.]|jgi:glutamate--cysteine ligase|nr:glutamate--cysteine ligase [Rubrivivax sp.]
MVPHLVTALTGPINELEARVLESMPAIERWFRLEWMEHTPPLYASIDLRNAGFKLAPVDTDLFPTSFGYLTNEMVPLAVQAAMAAIEKICPEAKNLLIVPAARRDNAAYLRHLQRLTEVFMQAGLNVRLGTLEAREIESWPLIEGGELRVEPLVRTRRRLGLKSFDPCTILLNTDLAKGAPGVLEDLHEQYLLPPLHAGWTVRRKSRHFQSYEELARKFAKLLGMDPWLLHPFYAAVPQFDPAAEGRHGMEALRTQVDNVLAKVRRKYKEYGIGERAFVVVKSDQGNAGSTVLTLHDAKGLDELDAAQRDMLAGMHEAIVQEGVPTVERIDNAAAEPVVLTLDRYVIGGHYRAHAGQGADRTLAAPGAEIVPLSFAASPQLPRPGAKPPSKTAAKSSAKSRAAVPSAASPNRFYTYGVIGRLATLAAAYELEATDPEAENFD